MRANSNEHLNINYGAHSQTDDREPARSASDQALDSSGSRGRFPATAAAVSNAN
jgi:hypothetical protein